MPFEERDPRRRGLLQPQRPLGGVLGPQQYRGHHQQQQQRAPSLLDRILGMYGADPTSHVPEQHRQGGIGAGLKGAGLAMLQASGASPGGFQQGLPQILGAGVMGWDQSRGIYAEALKKQAQQDQLRQMIESGASSSEQLQAIMMELIASGDMDGAKVVGDALKTMSAAKQAGQASAAKGQITEMMGEDGKMHKVLLDMVTGKPLKDLGLAPPVRGVVVSGVDGEGNPIDYLVNPETGEQIRSFKQPEKPPSQYSSEAESRLSQFRIARRNIVDGLEATGRGPTWAEWEMYNSGLPGRKTVSSEMQGLLQAQNLIVTQIAKELGGVRGAASKEFRNAIARTYLIAPGDQPKNIEQTLEALEEMERDLMRKAGMTDTEAGMTDDEIQDFIENAGGGAYESGNPFAEID
jgi:hypothetical protein